MILGKMFDWKNIYSKVRKFSFKQIDEDFGIS